MALPFLGSFGRVNCFLWFPTSLLILQVTWRSAGAAVDKTPNRCLIDMDHADWQSKFSDENAEAHQMAILKGEHQGDAEEVKIQIKSRLSQRDRFMVACREH